MMVIHVDGTRVCIENYQPFVQGTVGLQANVQLSEEWDGLTVTAVFATADNFDTRYPVSTGSGTITIPWEVLSEARAHPLLSFDGRDSGGNLIRRSSICDLGEVAPSMDPLGETPTPTPPYPDWYENVYEAGQQALQSAQDAEAYAKGTRGGTEVGTTDPAYHNNAKYFKEQAEAVRDSIPADYTELAGDVSELKSAIEDLEAMTNRKAGALVDNESGAIASFVPDATIPDLLGVTVDIEPVQDLHGYDAPWLAGGGKNLVDASKIVGNNISVDGDVITVNSQSGSSVVTSVPLSAVAPSLQAGDTCTLTLVTTGTVASYIWTRNGNPGGRWDSGTARTLDEEDLNIVFKFYGSGTIKMQIARGSTPVAWTPYSNVCPISGWDSVEVQTTGVNILPFPYAEGSLSRLGITYTVNGDGTITANGTASADSWFVLCNEWPYTADRITGRGIRLSGCPAGGSTSTFFLRSVVTGHNDVGDGVYLGNFRAGYFQFQISIKSGTTVKNLIFKPIIVFGNTAADFHPYSADRYTSQLGQTVYGGTLDVTNGTLTADRALLTLDGTQTELEGVNWRPRANSVGFYYTFSELNIKVPPTITTVTEAIVDTAKAVSYDAIYSNDICSFAVLRAVEKPRLFVRLTDTTLTTKTAINAYLAQHPITICYPLATPITITLDPVTFSTISGQTNNVWADAGDVSVEYAADLKNYIDSKIAAAVAALS